jgi:hypothetical protein
MLHYYAKFHNNPMRFQYNFFLVRAFSIISTHPAEIKTFRAAMDKQIFVACAHVLDVHSYEFSAGYLQ